MRLARRWPKKVTNLEQPLVAPDAVAGSTAYALRYCVDANGFDGIILNKMDILSDFEELKSRLLMSTQN